jgi:hypothetical protein
MPPMYMCVIDVKHGIRRILPTYGVRRLVETVIYQFMRLSYLIDVLGSVTICFWIPVRSYGPVDSLCRFQ